MRVLSELNRHSPAVPVVIVVNGKASNKKGRIGVRSFLPGLPVLKCLPDRVADGLFAEELKKHSPDFFIKFGNAVVESAIQDLTPLGVWEFRFGTQAKENTWPSGFYEVYHKIPVTPAVLVRFSGAGNEAVVLKEAHIKTRDTLKANRESMLREATDWPARVCRSLVRNPSKVFGRSMVIPEPAEVVNPGFQFRAVCFFYMLLQRIHSKYRLLLFTDFWNIGVVKAPIATFLKEQPPVDEWLPLKNRSRFFADPFACSDDSDPSKFHIFCETYPFSSSKGIIEHLTWKDGFDNRVEKVLENRVHLSYPFIFEESSRRYMIPEKYQSGKVDLYEPVDFPLVWEKKGTLLNHFSGIDSTLVKYNGLYWMFSSDRKDGYTSKLKLFYAESLEGPWIAHPDNPVKSDIRSSRSAGTPFVHEGVLYRPAMDYSEKLQGRIIINRVELLSINEFAETPVKELIPYSGSPFPDKIHTLTAMGDCTLIDGSKEVCVLSDFRLLVYNLKLAIKKFF